MSKELEYIKRKLERERKARRKAEEILESKSLELFSANENLRKVNSSLEELVAERTKDLKRTESRFESIVESANDIIYRINLDGFFTYANPTTLKTFGYSLQEIKGKSYLDFVDSHYLEEIKSFYTQQFKNRITGTYKEFPAQTKNGETVWLGQNVIFLFNEEQKLEQISAVARNITDSKISQIRLNNLIANLQSGVLLEDENRKIALVNKRFCNKFRISDSPEELRGSDFKDSFEQIKRLFIDEEAFAIRVDEILKQRKLVLNDEVKMKDGRIFERDYIPIFIENRYSGHLWNYRDVTTQQNTVGAIKRSEEKYRNIIENMNLGLLEVDQDHSVKYANQSFCEMSGYELGELLGAKATNLFARDENVAFMDEKNELREQGISDAYEIAVSTKNGDAKWWFISGAPLFDKYGMQQGSIGIHLDITNQKQLERDLVEAKFIAEESARVKEMFLANMSHEIRTPMNGIVGMARQLSKTELNKNQTFYLNIIQNAANNLLVILNDILDISKIEAGKLAIEKVPFDFKKSIKQSTMVLVPKAEEKGLQFDTKIDKNISSVLIGDPFRLNQVMLNLIGNAIKFTEKGSVQVICSLQESRENEQLLLIQVKDSGIGIGDEYLENIFEKFSQEDRATARQYGGTGLGMNISKQLVDLMNGNLTIDSSKGKGTCINLTIPFLLPNQEQISAQKIEVTDYKALRGKKVLIAEDNELNRLVIETTLLHYGIQMKMANNGKEAISLLKNQTFDLILMDVQMPVMDGMEACLYIRKVLKMGVPIVALTANVIKGDKERYFTVGMNDIVSKPFEEEKLLDTLLKWITGKESKSEKRMKENAMRDKKGFSLRKLHKISNGDHEFVVRMLSVFYELVNETVEHLWHHLENFDKMAISKVAHKIKPSLDNLEMTNLAVKARKIENFSTKITNKAEMEKLIVEFCHDLQEVVRKMKMTDKDN
ncbi:MAG: PAS domain S-box protein [Flavobacteriales bacterium]|nr:PAS domain S-box protein [Flavobacteriales bacterium]